MFFDTTNFSTEQQPHGDEDRLLARAGHAKDHNSQVKLVGLAAYTTDRYLPVIHDVFPGNTNDAAYFQHAVDSMIDTMKLLGVKCDDLCFVFDSGMNSEDAFGAIAGAKAHFVSSLKRNQLGDLVKRKLSDYTATYTTQSGGNAVLFFCHFRRRNICQNRPIAAIDGCFLFICACTLQNLFCILQ